MEINPSWKTMRAVMLWLAILVESVHVNRLIELKSDFGSTVDWWFSLFMAMSMVIVIAFALYGEEKQEKP